MFSLDTLLVACFPEIGRRCAELGQPSVRVRLLRCRGVPLTAIRRRGSSLPHTRAAGPTRLPAQPVR
jgi:hypothetical protein